MSSDLDGPGREEKKAQSRRRILEAAREVFFRDGFMAANLDHMAQGAGVAKGTLYRYFENKAELYVAVLAQDGEVFAQKLRETLDPALDPSQQIQATGRFYFDHWTANREYFQIFWAIENQSVIGELPREVIEEVTRLWESCLEVLSDIVEAGVASGHFRSCDPWEVATTLWTLANGLLQTQTSPAHRGLMRRGIDVVYNDALSVYLTGLQFESNTSV